MDLIVQVEAVQETAGDWRGAFDYQGLAYGTQYDAAYGSWPPASVEELICDPTILAVSLQWLLPVTWQRHVDPVCSALLEHPSSRSSTSGSRVVYWPDRHVFLGFDCRPLETCMVKSSSLRGCSFTLYAAMTGRACIAILIQQAKVEKTFGTLVIVGATSEYI